jgi:hypothetical protein
MEDLATQITIAIAPFLVYGMTHLIKKAQSVKVADNKRSLIRIFAALFSIAAVIGSSIASGATVDEGTVETLVSIFVQSVLVFFGATGLHEVSPRNNP